jgi:hypothetical protein
MFHEEHFSNKGQLLGGRELSSSFTWKKAITGNLFKGKELE